MNQNEMLSDIMTIKRAIDQTRIDNTGIKKLFFWYGLCNLILCLGSLLCSGMAQPLRGFGFVYPIFQVGLYGFILLLSVRTLRAHRRSQNKYYVTCLSLFLIAAVVLPLAFLCTRLTMAARGSGNANDLLIQFAGLERFLNLFVFSAFLIMIALSERKTVLAILAIANLFAYLILSVLDSGIAFPFMGRAISAEYSGIYYMVILSAGYLLLGWNGRWKKDGSNAA